MTKIDDPATSLHFIVSEPNLPAMEIVHPQTDSSFVFFAARVVPSEYAQRKLLEMDLGKRNELSRDIRNKLLLCANVEFTIAGGESGMPKAYELFSRLFIRENTVQDFWETYVKMKSAVVMIVSLIQDFVGLG